MPLSRMQFHHLIAQLPNARSYKQKRIYTLYGIKDNFILFKREKNMAKKPEKLPFDELWNIYQHLDYIDTQNVQRFIKQWMYSPACAILMAAGIYSYDGIRQL